MRRILSILLFTPLLAITAVSAPQHWRTDEFSLNLQPGWSITDTTSGYPYHLYDSSHTAELFLFRSNIRPEETIDDEQMLQVAVGEVINSVLPEMSELKMLRSSGYLDHDRAIFVIDFLSTDSASGLQIYHRMSGTLYRLEDNSQALFTLWAKTDPLKFDQHRLVIESLMDSFQYTGPRQPSVFVSGQSDNAWFMVFLVVGLTAAVLYFNRVRLRKARSGFTENDSFWRCSCGRLNHQSRSSCRRCGKGQLVA